VRKAAAAAGPAVVAVRVVGAKTSASGVIITADGLVLSQFHVTHADRSAPGAVHIAGTRTTVILPGGRECPAELLGATRVQDLSLLQLLEPGPYPFTPLKPDAAVRAGDWALKLGHTGGYQADRPAPVRLGRVVAATADGFCTDCRIAAGDSGGPFFDLDRRLVGIVRAGSADLLALLPATRPPPSGRARSSTAPPGRRSPTPTSTRCGGRRYPPAAARCRAGSTGRCGNGSTRSW
jgi:serine protease Do